VIREPAKLLSLAAGVAVAEVCGERTLLKWPNDVLIDGRKVAGILVEGRPQERWAVLGIGINVALDPAQLPEQLRDRAGTLGRASSELEPTLERLRMLLDRWLVAPDEDVLEAVRARDALQGRRISWEDRSGVARGIVADGRLEVELDGGGRIALDAGEVHLSRL
jgi:BirA family biotin operon repressor/biotin-[acetyl-CoA-carboxylase] ligase